jgi:hypothetical protein
MTNSALHVASHAGLCEDLVASHLLQIKTKQKCCACHLWLFVDEYCTQWPNNIEAGAGAASRASSNNSSSSCDGVPTVQQLASEQHSLLRQLRTVWLFM